LLTTNTEIPPRADVWQRSPPAEVGFDESGIQAAVAYACEHETDWLIDLSEQKAIAGDEPPPWNEILGPLKPRGGPTGVIVSRGDIIAEWGNADRVDTTFSATKSYIALCALVALRLGLIRSLDDLLQDYDLCAHFETPQNQRISWRHLLQQTSEWEGTLWTKPDQVDRNRQVGPGSRTSAKGGPRRLCSPGSHWEYNDVRVNLAALCLTLLFGRPLGEVLREYIMDPIGAGRSWEWYGYRNSWVEINGRTIPSVSGGAHWGGGLWISAIDHARMGLLIARGGFWGGYEVLPRKLIAQLFEPCVLNPSYGLMWWLNTDREMFASAPESSVFAYGAGANYVWVDAPRDLVAVVRWINPDFMDGFIARVMGAATAG
tara:strand:+ start:1424 stop:2545 length:1122 start_codon:yes stop_codon:yes gene_type:complete